MCRKLLRKKKTVSEQLINTVFKVLLHRMRRYFDVKGIHAMSINLLLLVPTLKLGGQERICAKTAELLKEYYNVFIVVFDKSDMVYHPDCEIIDLNMPARNGKWNKVCNAIRRSRALKQLRKEKSADFVYSFGTTANLVNVLSRGTGKTLIGLRGYASVNVNSYLNRYAYRRCDTIVGCAEGTCNPIRHWKPTYAEKTKCLYNPLDVAFVEKSGQNPVADYTFSPHTIVSHGRLDEVKNWPRLIKAFSIVKKDIPDARLLIIGEGEQRHQLQQLIDSYGLQDSATLIGFRQNPFAYLAKSSLYVLPSYSEGFPNSLVEGMVFLPTISVDCKSGPREIMSDAPIDTVAQGVEYADYGILVQPATDRAFHAELTKDDEILAQAILAVLTNEELATKMKNAARERAQEFSCERYREKLIEILEE